MRFLNEYGYMGDFKIFFISDHGKPDTRIFLDPKALNNLHRIVVPRFFLSLRNTTVQNYKL